MLAVLCFPVDLIILAGKAAAVVGYFLLVMLKGISYRCLLEVKAKMFRNMTCSLNSFLFIAILVLSCPVWTPVMMVMGVVLKLRET